MDEEKVKKLKALFETIQDGVTKEEFVKSFENVVNFILKVEKRLEAERKIALQDARRIFKEFFDRNKDHANIILDDIREKSEGVAESFVNVIDEAVKETKEATEKNKKEVKEFLDEKGGEIDRTRKNMEIVIRSFIEDTDKLMTESKDRIEKDNDKVKVLLTEQENGMNFIRDKVRDYRKEFENDFDFFQEWLEKHDNDIEELKKRPVKVGGGGTSEMGVKFALGNLVKKETPVGDINGTNKVFTVSQEIFAVISFVINGQAISDDEYSVSGSTITFNDAIDASLLGASFRIAYV